jgi:hypothetical protein
VRDEYQVTEKFLAGESREKSKKNFLQCHFILYEIYVKLLGTESEEHHKITHNNIFNNMKVTVKMYHNFEERKKEDFLRDHSPASSKCISLSMATQIFYSLHPVECY